MPKLRVVQGTSIGREGTTGVTDQIWPLACPYGFGTARIPESQASLFLNYLESRIRY
ncbi:MAG: hypothetical protein JWL57_2232 [Actinobacteria bacterium]|nr:hypothetical protein [Actinomycetota bacterium]